jgi:prepilin peptidase CpaA
MGGGDVKLLGALALWLPVGPLVWMLCAMSIAGGAITLVLLAERAWRRGAGTPVEVPYGVAIAMAGLLVLSRT